MYSMSYCRMENTYRALSEARESLDDPANESEQEYRQKLVLLCKEIADEYAEE